MTGNDRSDHPASPSGADGVVWDTFDWAATSPSAAVVQVVSIAADRSPHNLEPLYGVIDPDALNAIFRSPMSSTLTQAVSISFEYARHEVRVESGGTVAVRPVEARSGSASANGT